MAHNREKHFDYLQQLCRICGGSVQTQKQKRNNKKVNSIDSLLLRDISFVCGFDLDITENHSNNVCYYCYKKIRNCKERASVITRQSLLALIDECNHLWQPFDSQIDELDCEICKTRATIKQGGRKKQKEHVQRHVKKDLFLTFA